MARDFGIVGIRQVITGFLANAIEFPAPLPSRLMRIFVRISAPNSAGDALFDVKINGTTIFGTPADRPKIVTGATTGFVDVDVELFENDLISVDVVAAPLGGISGLYIMVQIEDSPTVVQYIRGVYDGALRRAPTGPEASTATTDLQTGCASNTTLDATKALLDGIFGGAEFLALSTTNTEYVERLYRSILARPSDSGGRTFWVARLVAGATRQDVRDAFNTSSEHVLLRLVGWCPNTLPSSNAVRLQDWPVGTANPTTGQLLQFDGTSWVPATLSILSTVFDFKDSARATTTAALPAFSSTAGVITASANGALAAIDGVTLIAGNRLLIKNESGGNQKYNGLYDVTQIGTVSTPFILTRSADANSSAEVSAGIFIPIAEGTVNADAAWWLTTNDPIVLDTTALTFAQFGASATPIGAAGGDLSGTFPNPTVTQARGLRETTGPTTLTLGAVADGQLLKRVSGTVVGVDSLVEIGIAVSDEITAITTGTAKVTFRMPFAMTLTSVRASLTVASSSGIPTVDINEAGTSVLSTKLTIDASEKTSQTAATAAVISDAALADDAEITIDIDVAGTGAMGLKVWLIGTRA